MPNFLVDQSHRTEDRLSSLREKYSAVKSPEVNYLSRKHEEPLSVAGTFQPNRIDPRDQESQNLDQSEAPESASELI